MQPGQPASDDLKAEATKQHIQLHFMPEPQAVPLAETLSWEYSNKSSFSQTLSQLLLFYIFVET